MVSVTPTVTRVGPLLLAPPDWLAGAVLPAGAAPPLLLCGLGAACWQASANSVRPATSPRNPARSPMTATSRLTPRSQRGQLGQWLVVRKETHGPGLLRATGSGCAGRPRRRWRRSPD